MVGNGRGGSGLAANGLKLGRLAAYLAFSARGSCAGLPSIQAQRLDAQSLAPKLLASRHLKPTTWSEEREKGMVLSDS